jgi:uncharacterized membrane protein YgdD (TMEM256/DUF423 family)
MSINWWTVGSLYGAASVAFGAFGAHGLKSRGISDAKIASWSTAAHYQVSRVIQKEKYFLFQFNTHFQLKQLIHSVALVAVETAFPGKQKIWAKSLLTAGMTMFSGSIYLLVLDPQRFKAMGPITPLGGVALIGGWVALAVGSRGRIALK